MVRRKARGPAANTILPGYTVLEEIGGGAFATVYRAVEDETGRHVALKILKVDTVHAHLVDTFHKEIQALAGVSDHPNIVTLYRPSTTSDGRPVLVLEHCRESLQQRLRNGGPLGAAEATRIGIKIAGALETAHRNGFLHRDMKPQNILVTQFGEPALADFGVAALQASAQMTAGVFGFTTLHAAPEMLEGHHLSPATDVYGLASTMYQVLTGHAPFTTFENEAPASVILRILRDPVPPLRAEHIPLDLADLLEAALSKEPEGRPRTAADFARMLQAVEVAEGWGETSFVAWGEEGVLPRAGEPPPGRGPLGAASGGMSPPAEASPRALPPLLPPAGAASPPAPAGPSLVAPEPAARNVVLPVHAVRGRMGPPPDASVRAPSVPVIEPRAGGEASPQAREPSAPGIPMFVDPEPFERRPGGSDYEEAAGAGEPHHGLRGRRPAGYPVRPAPRSPGRPPGGRSGPTAAPPAHPPADLPMWAIAAFVMAVLVIVAAGLIVGGVI